MNNRKRKVADIALQLFVEKGIQQTSIQEIIEKANISKGTFYNYFSSKNDCVSDILEILRYDASQQRIAIQFGKDAKDRGVFIEQITILLCLNEERNLHALFEAILFSNETDLKRLVLQHRMIEMEWLSERLIEVMGEEIREYAFEGTILFYGMLQHMLFTIRISNSTYSLHRLVDAVLSYLELILSYMSKNQISMLDHCAIHTLRNQVDKKKVTIKELQELAQQMQQQYEFTSDQQDLFEAIMQELKQVRMRKIVLQQLIGPFQKLFKETAFEVQVNTFTNLLWFYLKTI
jgi:AcrR family transcriptional regulator